MTKYTIVAMSNPVEGREAEFNRWYDEQHLKDVASVEGVTGARRLNLVAADGRWLSLALYDADVEDPQSLLNEIRSRSGTSLMPVSDALDRGSIYLGLFAENGG